MIKAHSLEVTLPAIILIRDVFRVSLPEQNTTKKGRVYEMYEMYEMYEIYEMYKIAEALPVTLNGLHLRWLDL